MKIKQDPITKLWCREDGAVLMPPTATKFRQFRWTFGSRTPDGYRQVRYRGKHYRVHQLVCRAFRGLAPEGKPLVDHIDRCRVNNSFSNLHWVSAKENNDNAGRVDESIERYGVRACEDKKAYMKAYNRSYWVSKYAKMKAQGFHYIKGSNGKWGWFPRVHKSEAA